MKHIILLALACVALGQSLTIPVSVDSSYVCTDNGCTGGPSTADYTIANPTNSWSYFFFEYDLSSIPVKSDVFRVYVIFNVKQPVIADPGSSTQTKVDVVLLPAGKKIPTSATTTGEDLGSLTYQTKGTIVFNTMGTGLGYDVTTAVNQLLSAGQTSLGVNLADAQGSIVVQSMANNGNSSYLLVWLGAETIAPNEQTQRSQGNSLTTGLYLIAALTLAALAFY
jgi:hypothetical protein